MHMRAHLILSRAGAWQSEVMSHGLYHTTRSWPSNPVQALYWCDQLGSARILAVRIRRPQDPSSMPLSMVYVTHPCPHQPAIEFSLCLPHAACMDQAMRLL